ncbi:MAG: DNA primase [Chlamydiae bacterium]|nr:DNA primase [Chlamydiota bacterium]
MKLIDLAIEKGLEPRKVSPTHGGEYASSCPDCGGEDRFRIWPNRKAKNCEGVYWCRQCEKSGDTIQFCREFLGLSFKEAAKRASAEISQHTYTPREPRSFTFPALTPPSEKWQQKASGFVSWAEKRVGDHPAIVQMLEDRGLSKEAIERYRIGYCDQDLWGESLGFGIESEKKIFLPKGIVIPSIETSGEIIRVKIRRTDRKEGDKLPKYWEIKGGMNGLNIVGAVRNPVMVVVESELDALAVHSACGDFAFAISVGSCSKTPDNVVDYWAKRKPHLLISHDNDAGGLVMKAKWEKLYSRAKSFPVPEGKDVGEAIERGLDVRSWVLSGLPEGLLNNLNKE